MVQVREATLDEVRELQQAVLRPHGPIPGDAPPPPTAIHVGAFEGGSPVGAVTILPNHWPGPGALVGPTWQLRGMAVRADRRGAGIGGRVLAHAERVAAEQGAVTLWAAARVDALPFYAGAGWSVVGPDWDKPGVGPHRYVTKLAAGSPF